MKGDPISAGQFAQSDLNRVATLAMRDNLDGIYLLMDKLYKRNPREWKKTYASQQIAMQAIKTAVNTRTPPASMEGRRDIKALSYALEANYPDDRVGAFIFALADMLITAHGDNTEFYLTSGLDAQSLYNAARNMEIAAWILNSRKGQDGAPLLLANEINTENRNMSFEREFGKIIGRVDLLAEMTDEKYRRPGINYLQSLVGAQFLQFLPVASVAAVAAQ
jgi:hypothetical protein